MSRKTKLSVADEHYVRTHNTVDPKQLSKDTGCSVKVIREFLATVVNKGSPEKPKEPTLPPPALPVIDKNNAVVMTREASHVPTKDSPKGKPEQRNHIHNCNEPSQES